MACGQLPEANATIGPLFDAADTAYFENPANVANLVLPWLRGTRIHADFALRVTALRGPYSAEVSYRDGLLVPYGTQGSIRADAVVGPRAAPHYAVELKSGLARPTPAETRAYARHLPPGAGVCAIAEAFGR